MNYKEEHSSLQTMVDYYLKVYFENLYSRIPEKKLIQSMAYSIMSSGKRIRPVLSLSTAKLLNGSPDAVMPFAAAIEMIHTYSLIHDDLPAMDNDDYRRGKPSNHKIYGEAMAILAGDALLNEAFELMLGASLNSGLKMEMFLRAALLVAEAAGKSGMIGGQVIDGESEGKTIDADTLKLMHGKKTGALLKASILAPAIITGATQDETEALSQYAEYIGTAFQIKDDILDVTGTTEELGKPAGSDAKNMKTTYASLFGLDEANRLLNETTNKAVDALNRFGDRAWFLKETAYFIAKRSH